MRRRAGVERERGDHFRLKSTDTSRADDKPLCATITVASKASMHRTVAGLGGYYTHAACLLNPSRTQVDAFPSDDSLLSSRGGRYLSFRSSRSLRLPLPVSNQSMKPLTACCPDRWKTYFPKPRKQMVQRRRRYACSRIRWYGFDHRVVRSCSSPRDFSVRYACSSWCKLKCHHRLPRA
jgi:hypothetical protein